MNGNAETGDEMHKEKPMNSDGSAGNQEVEPFDITKCSPEYLQRKLYFLVNKLKEMHSDLPDKFQSRITYELLSDLASSLLNETAFEIVRGLMDIQHTTEEHLHRMRKEAENECQTELNEWLSKITDDEELRHILQLMNDKHTKIMKDIDTKIISTLDQKIYDQQFVLHQAGIAGFYITSDAKEINIQMLLLDFIIRLSRIKYQEK